LPHFKSYLLFSSFPYVFRTEPADVEPRRSSTAFREWTDIYEGARERERERGGGIAEDQATPRDERRGAIRESKLSGYRQNRWARLHASRVMVYAPLPAAYMFMIQRMQTCGREGARNLCVTRASARDARKRDRDC